MDDTRNSVPFNLAEIKKLARQSLDQGAVTQDYPLNLEQAHKILNDALATEIMCVLRYVRLAVSSSSGDR